MGEIPRLLSRGALHSYPLYAVANFFAQDDPDVKAALLSLI